MPVDKAIQALLDGPLLNPLGRTPGPTGLGPKYRKRGHFMPPGTGPEGQTCKTCKHLSRVIYAKTYLKCGRMKHNWTGSYGTDVRAGDDACGGWEEIT